MTPPQPARTACVQLELNVDAVQGNRAACLHGIARARDAGAQVVVLPELANTGYVFRDRREVLNVAEPADGPTITEWIEAAHRASIVLAAGFAERGEDGAIYNSAVLIDPDGLRVVYRKAHLWDYEKELFTPGSQAPPVVDTLVGQLGLMICYDLEFPEWVRMVATAGAQLLCAPTNWPLVPYPAGQTPMEVVKVQANAALNRMAVAACDRTGAERGVDWLGGSVIVDVDGYPRTEPHLGTPGMLVADVDLAPATDKAIGPRNDVHADRRADLYAHLDGATGAAALVPSEGPPVCGPTLSSTAPNQSPIWSSGYASSSAPDCG